MTRRIPAVCVVAVLLGAVPATAHAQSLDIGGIELRIGQNVDEALRSLSLYEVRYTDIGDGLAHWAVMQRNGDYWQQLGSLNAQANVITNLSKAFSIGETKNTTRVYKLALRELHRRGGEGCARLGRG